jgi:uncharacterized protein YbjT (DUF2867 family)
MTTPILVTGGTGTLGRHVFPRLLEAGRGVRVLTRREQVATERRDGVEHVVGDLLDGSGVEAAVRDVETVLHLAGGPKGDDRATEALVRAAEDAGVEHVVLISVIASDLIPLGYFRAKAGAERAVAESGIPHSILRAAQFHDLTLTVAQKMGAMPVVPAPGGLRWQPVDSREVAVRLVELAVGHPAGRVADLAGPESQSLADLTRRYLAVRGRRRPFLPVRIPGKAGKAYRAGDNLAAATADRGTRTWEEFLAERRPSSTICRTAGPR